MIVFKPKGRALPPVGLLIALGLAAAPAGAQSQSAGDVTQLERVVVKAEQELKQTPGASTITATDIEKAPPANDVSEIIRTMPGVNLTGNSSSGQRGNNRQIDIRGMGPENTLILIDGKPVSSRGSVRFGWRGERDTRGDTNWVPPEMIERIEVLRGPAAARYGNGAAGGVVNIITKPAADTLTGSVSTYLNAPQHSDEGSTARTTFSLAGPLTDSLDFRLYGSAANFQGDAYDINKDHASARGGANKDTFPAGREGFKNRDIGGVLSWKPAAGHKIDFGASYGREGNIYVGDTQNTNSNAVVKSQVGNETNRIYRQAYSITHTGDWNADTHTLSYLQYEQTRNTRLLEGLAGGTEGLFNDPAAAGLGGYGDINLRTLTAHTELNRRLNWGGVDQMGTLGLEWVRQDLEDNASDLASRNTPNAKMPKVPFAYTPKVHANIYSLFAEDNLYIGDHWTVTPGLRFDHHTQQGNNWSPSLNLSYLVDDQWTVKAGIARAYKAANLYQSNAGYALYSAGNGCWGNTSGSTTGCFLVGNPDLKAETSLNKELGLEYRSSGGLGASLTYFHNDYRNKIEAGRTPVGSFVNSIGLPTNVFQWENIPRAVVQGLEGNLTWPFARDWLWSTNATYMIESKNKDTGEHLSTIPEYTVNSTLDWSVTPAWSLRAKATVYGEQEGPKYDYYGNPLTGSATDKIPPYAIFGLSTQYKVSKHLRVTMGVDNVFDKRLFRAGNAIGVNMETPNYINGAGAYTYNQPGRTFFLEATTLF